MLKLKALKGSEGIQLEAVVDASVFSKRPRSPSKQQNGWTFLLSVNVYGPPHQSSDVATRLSTVSAYLQHPYSLPGNMRYDNPQFFKLPGVAVDMNTFVGTAQLLASRKAELAEDVFRVLDSDSLLSGEGDSDQLTIEGLKTALHKHQEIAVTFVLDRESVEKVRMLHKKMAIVQAPSTASDGTAFGGIIADRMGLGKTLSTLAAILKSLERSRDFATGIAGRTHATLVVVTSAQLIDVWLTERSSHLIKDALKVAIFHGQNRAKRIKDSADFDLVLTTYGTLASDHKSKGPLHQIKWYRVVLDEAHWIRNSSSKQFRAATSLESRSRWCLTGTPIQNSLNDLFSLAEFLRLPPLEAKHAFNTRVITSLTTGTTDAKSTLSSYLQAFCLRRNLGSINLPPSRTVVVEISLSKRETMDYKAILNDAKRRMDATVSRKNITTYNTLFTTILKLRRFCDIGTLALQGTQRLGLAPDAEDTACGFCSSTDDDILSLLNSHTLCPFCFRHLQPASPLPDSGPKSSLGGISEPSSSGEFPTKLSRVLMNITEDDPDSKHIVFSCWTATLDLLSERLTSAGIGFLIIDGRISSAKRQQRLDKFRTEPSIRALLMTIGTGGVGLTLTVANRVHIVEPQWNPSVEDQAIGRALRIGQSRPVIVYRYLTRNSVEQNMANFQEKKKNLARATIDGGSDETIDDKLAVRYPPSLPAKRLHPY
ncbi:SNF2 family N-terminal domain-containing protein [Cercophora newfieldiana]|uniref:SNF2 family N-terminal domain-containing protein n=1 Tax=Cercophora newfieldiana TaxID=92897 RepID=A0AA39Y7A0_9PEZI|nr:SNF2 family N-terminal domain-containing protein [Cercophora newfieldiana]